MLPSFELVFHLGSITLSHFLTVPKVSIITLIRIKKLLQINKLIKSTDVILTVSCSLECKTSYRTDKWMHLNLIKL